MREIFEMIRAQKLDALKALLAKQPRALDAVTADGICALHEVMRQGNLELVQFVVEYGIVNLNLLDRMGNTVLHYGVESGNPELVRYLVERVSSPITQANLKGETSLDTAKRLGREEILNYFEECLGATSEELYHNPIRRGMHPDPSVVRVGEDYYMVNSSFQYFPCIPVSHSRDLIHWEVIGHAITAPEWARLRELEGGRGYWAPDISYFEGKFYITATYRLNDGGSVQRLQMVTSSDRPEGPYCEPVFLDEDGIDPSIFTDVDGRRYMLLNRGTRIFEISADGRQILSKPKLLWYGENKKASEGPHMLYKDGFYYLFMAEGGTGMGHRISVARSKTLMGVYESCPYNPILRQWDENLQLQCCGHGMPVETPAGDWYMLYLCSRVGTAGYAVLGRETALDPITWTVDGWPLVNYLRGPSDLQKRPRCGYHASEAEAQWQRAIDLQNGIWGDWFTIRGFVPGTFAGWGGEIRIRGNGKDLNRIDYNTVLLRHQEDFVFEMNWKVSVEETADGMDWDAGLTCYYDENSYLKLALGRKNGINGILAAEYIDDAYATDIFLPSQDSFIVGEKPVLLEPGRRILTAELKIITEDLKRILYFRTKDGVWQQAAVFENTSYLSSEGLKKGKRFTGAAAGIYVNGMITGYFAEVVE